MITIFDNTSGFAKKSYVVTVDAKVTVVMRSISLCKFAGLRTTTGAAAALVVRLPRVTADLE